jgi:hypothetical protein
MGVTRSISISYGIPFKLKGKLADDADDAVDIEFLISDNYPGLEYDFAGGDYFGTAKHLVIIAGMGTTEYDKPLIKIAKYTKKKPSPEALGQLENFCLKYGLDFKPEWIVHSYSG